MFQLELETRDIPRIYTEFAQLIGEKCWRNRARACNEAIRGNRLLRDYLLSEYSVVFTLEHCANLFRRYKTIPPQEQLNRKLYPALTFAAQVLVLVKALTEPHKTRFIKRVRAAMANSEDMRAVRLELRTATHFVRKGLLPEWPEHGGTGRCDLFIPALGPNGLNVECKAVSEDKGCKIHRRDALAFWGLLVQETRSLRRSLKTGVYVVLKLPDRLPSRHSDQRALAGVVRRQIVAGRSENFDRLDIRIGEFDHRQVLETAPQMELIERITGTKNCHAFVTANQSGSFLFVVRSVKDSTPVAAMFQGLRDSAAQQLDRSVPALFVVGFDGVTIDQLFEISARDRKHGVAPSALRLGVTDFLSSPSRSHVVGVAFLSGGALQEVSSDIVRETGASYYFPNETSKFWSEDFREV